MARMIDADQLWEKLKAQKEKNKELEVGFHINMGINQAIGLLNSMMVFEMYEEKDNNEDNA